jgi:hypothetical protein
MMSDLSVEYEMTLAEHQAISTFFERGMSNGPRLNRKHLVHLWVMGILGTAFLSALLRGQLAFLLWFGFVIIAALLLLAVRIRYLSGSAVARMVHERPEDFLGPVRVTITPRGITCSSRNGEVFRSWAGMDGIAATETHALIYRPYVFGTAVPKRAFVGDDEFTDFIRTIQRYLADAASDRPSQAPRPVEHTSDFVDSDGHTPHPAEHPSQLSDLLFAKPWFLAILLAVLGLATGTGGGIQQGLGGGVREMAEGALVGGFVGFVAGLLGGGALGAAIWLIRTIVFLVYRVIHRQKR